MKVKICGIRDADTALAAVAYGADAIGFVFAESKRKVELEKAKDIIEKLPSEVMKVGVFVNETLEGIEKIANFTGLTHIQLHGDEAASLSERLTLPVIKAASIETDETLEEIKNYPCEYLLLDGPKGKYRGGNGIAFNWKNINLDILKEKKIILAGGLHQENVEEAIQTIQPDMVDVSSGVETDGKKDLQKIKLFIEKAKGSLTRRTIV
ncbi:phosphoribosylanthranilate isomerase [Bacillus salipaludis]|uniref:N-(5'-phosphoribosyl)anthranilate isomerase n=1 Tax=Bacillus salipaludis TaxID=2547811 RepID=A0A4V6PMD1_9BACI|nr:phosphoribosylanthranilate isomerase [Bacillus salipaludis]MDQ6599283.1 phosphoribosylanthranilate isomerase [Bacillus salipaludis]TDK58922.1 phosphoribosylanthranilate isomerase [Bacillus salipaludis]